MSDGAGAGAGWARRLATRRMRRTRPRPYQTVAVAFVLLISAGTVLLLLPVARAGPGGAGVADALFTATSAACVVGLAVVDTGTYWTGFGQAVILGLVQAGGLGIMAGASLVGIAVSRRLGLRTQLMAAEETQTLSLSDVRRVVVGVVRLSLAFEALVALALALRFGLGYDIPWGQAAWDGLFHAVSAFNNAGLSLFPDGLTEFVTDPWVCLPIDLAVILGGLGFPVLFEVFRDRRRWRGHRRLSPNTRVALAASAILLVVGTVAFWLTEHDNQATIADLGGWGQLLASFTQSVMPRSAGLNSVDFGLVHQTTLVVTTALMFVGGASASTAGGIKVGTAAVAGASVWAQLRGDEDTVLAGRTVPQDVVRQAYSLIFLFAGTLLVGIVVLLGLSDVDIGTAMFETTSALTTTGLSTGVTPELPQPALVVLTILMYVGRLGPVSLGAALALRHHQRLFRYPEGRPHVG